MKKNDKKKQDNSQACKDEKVCDTVDIDDVEKACGENCEGQCQSQCDGDCNKEMPDKEKKNKETKKSLVTIEELMVQNAELNDKLLRQMAEFDNFKRRTAKEKDDMFAYAKINCINEFLSVIDNFERALAVETTDEGYKKGMIMIFNQYLDILKKQGVAEIEAQGVTFDPNLHNAVNQVEDENFGENTVCQVFQKGYILGDKVLRHAMVVVANP